MGYQTGLAVGLAVGVPVVLAFSVALIFLVKTRRRFAREDAQMRDDEEYNNVNQDLVYDNIHELRITGKKEETSTTNTNPSSGSSDDGKNGEKLIIQSDSTPSSPKQENNKKQKRYVPAYRKQLKSSMTNLANSSRNSSLSNLNNANVQGSNSSINSTNTNITDHFYSSVVPVMGTPDTSNSKQHNSLSNEINSIDLAKSLHQPNPAYGKKTSSTTPTRSYSNSLNGDEYNEYNLKNNYNLDNEFEIQEEDQYENEFTNYSENKRTFIESLRPKTNKDDEN